MEVWGLTDPGCIRTQNQDFYAIWQFEDPDCLLAILCDGMGGAKSGNVASSLAADVFLGEIQRNMRPGLRIEDFKGLMSDALALANQAVYEHSFLSNDFAGMGTTLVAALVMEGTAIVANVGDSRAYLVKDTGIRQITVDHSVVEMMVRRGEISPEEAQHHPVKNLITRAVGTEPRVLCDIFTLPVEKGNCILLCSDGLSNVVSDQEILFEIVHGLERSACCGHLLEIAKNRGAPDNVTTVIISV